MSEELNLNGMSYQDIFGSSEMSYEEAQAKFAAENKKRNEYLRFDKPGTYPIRILPLAPVIVDGKPVPPERKGYEYPCYEYTCKLRNGVDDKGQPRMAFCTVVDTRLAFPQLDNDPIILYADLACEKHSSDKALVEAIRKSCFDNGLRFDGRRYMYVIDRRDGKLKLLGVSNPTFKDIEAVKMTNWEKLCKRNPKAPCPISSVSHAYDFEVERTDTKPIKYKVGINFPDGETPLTGEELKALFDAPRIPEVIYRYSRRMFEATVAFLKECDERFGINISDDPKLLRVLEQVKSLIPSDDTSHWQAGAAHEDSKTSASIQEAMDSFWDALDELDKNGETDGSERANELRGNVMQFIEDHDIDVVIPRRTPIADILAILDEHLHTAPAGQQGKADEKQEEPEEEPQPEEEEPASQDEENPASDKSFDTAEPARRPRPVARQRR